MSTKVMNVSTAVYFTMGAHAQILVRKEGAIPSDSKRASVFSRKGEAPPPIADSQKKGSHRGKSAG